MPPGQEILPALYEELRALARARLARGLRWQTLSATALVHEAYARLERKGAVSWENRAHFFGAAARAMRDVLVEIARRKAAVKRGGNLVRVDLSVSLASGESAISAEDLLALQHALTAFQASYPEHATVVMMRYFGGLELRQVAELTGMSYRAAEGKWRFAQAWLRKELRES